MKISFLQQPMSIGGPGSFQIRLEQGLKRLGHDVIVLSGNTNEVPDFIITLGAPLKRLPLLIWWKMRGARIVQRLAGFYWRHRVDSVSMRASLVCMLRNRAMHIVRDHLADYVVYQSKFVQDWWHMRCGPGSCPETVIVNGVDLQEFTASNVENGNKKPVLIVAEGRVNATIPTMEVLRTLPPKLANREIIGETIVYGRLAPDTKDQLTDIPGLKIMGSVPRERMSRIYARRGIYLSVRVNHSCPNTVLEALACGMPVIGFDTGALSELVSPEAGYIVPYGANPWQLEPPDISGLYQAVESVANRLDEYRWGARALAERRFNLDTMISSYMKVFRELL